MMTDNRSPCNITSMCDASSTTCHDDSSKVECTCKPGFVNNTLIIGTDVLNPHYECSLAQEFVTKTTPTASATTSTTTSPARLMSTITSTTTSPTTLISTITSTMTPSTSMSFTTSLFLTSSVTSFTTTDRLYTTFGLSMTDNFSSPSSPSDMTCKSMKSKLAPFSEFLIRIRNKEQFLIAYSRVTYLIKGFKEK
ncbi:hypothetical protein DPMN_159691 [Dreissena polymorpha]|uniref:Uncharacterized protein n=1 Tax=Dreissena polymorpha TaxID=45954 RepID=A0A9D4ELG1_DREPO|nr:hypothetical protein DPMN_159691 [Dreissena polymorpha]